MATDEQQPPTDQQILDHFADAKVFLFRDYPEQLRDPGDQKDTSTCWAVTGRKSLNFHMFQENVEGQVSFLEIAERTPVVYPQTFVNTDVDPAKGLSNRVENAFKLMTNEGLYMEQDYPPSEHLRDLSKMPYIDSPKMKIFIESHRWITPDICPIFHKGNRRMLKRGQPLVAHMSCLKIPFKAWAEKGYDKWSGTRDIYTEDEHQRRLASEYPSEWTREDYTNFGGLFNHAIFLVGYGQDDNDWYYIIQSSSGKSWGYGGFAKIKCDCVIEAGYPEGCYTIESTDEWWLEKKEEEKKRRKQEESRRAPSPCFWLSVCAAVAVVCYTKFL